MRLAKDEQVGIAWYSREGWERLAQLADDRQVLDESFETWERLAKAALLELEVSGHSVQKVPIDVEALAQWCRAQSRPLDVAARAEYVSQLLRERRRRG